MMPEFAIVGHPNEGKSSVVSTLAEDDSVRISATPGETIQCQTFTVTIDGRSIIQFTDTPGFQNPRRTLQWMQEYNGPSSALVEQFRATHTTDPEFADDCELLLPVTRGAGIIYVVDGSRPLRNVDRAEMEILRLTGRPRMAIINCKQDDTGYLDEWKNEFRKHFNAVRVFNSHQATYAERIELLKSLEAIDQDWQPALETVILAFKEDWGRRNRVAAGIVGDLAEQCLTYTLARPLAENVPETKVQEQLKGEYIKKLATIEREAQQLIRRLFKHNIFQYDLPPQSILHDDLFGERTWELLGLSKGRLIVAAAMSGAALGGALDLVVGATSLGLFMAVGGVSGAGYAALGGVESLARTRVMGKKLGGQQLRIGPNRNIQFLYILLDRQLIYYSQIINWAHGRRNSSAVVAQGKGSSGKAGFTNAWEKEKKKICNDFFGAVLVGDDDKRDRAKRNLSGMIEDILDEISGSSLFRVGSP